MCTVIACLARERLEIFALNVASPAIVSKLCCKYEEGVQQHSSMGLACFGRHLIHNVVTAGFAVLKNNIHNPIQTEARERKQVLER